jgi:hypothetical protein
MSGWSAPDRPVEQAKSGMSTAVNSYAVNSYAMLGLHKGWILSAKFPRLVFLAVFDIACK